MPNLQQLKLTQQNQTENSGSIRDHWEEAADARFKRPQPTELPAIRKIKQIGDSLSSPCSSTVSLPRVIVDSSCILNSKPCQHVQQMSVSELERQKSQDPFIHDEQSYDNAVSGGKISFIQGGDLQIDVSLKIPKSKIIPPQKSYNWKKIYAVAGLTLLTLPLTYIAYRTGQFHSAAGYAVNIFEKTFNQTTFDSTFGPFALDIGLPVVRSGCYSASLLLSARKALQGIAALGLKIIPGTQNLRRKASDAFKRHLIRDLTLIAGLMSFGYLLEGVESDLNLYFQGKEISKMFFHQLANTPTWSEFFTKLFSVFRGTKETIQTGTALAIQEPVKGISSDFISKISKKFKLMTQTGLYSMKKLRFTPLKSYHFLERNCEIPLSHLGIVEAHECSALTQFFKNFSCKLADLKACYNQEGCLVKHTNDYSTVVCNFVKTFFEDPTKFAKDYLLSRYIEFRNKINNSQLVRIYNFINSIFGRA